MNRCKLLLSVFAFFFVSPCFAELRPEEIAILAVRGSRGSEGLAQYYAKARAIPEKNICKLVMPKGETLSRKEWTWAIRPEIQKWITENDPDKKIRCLVTTWDVPLKIGRASESDQLQQYQEFLQGERTSRLKNLQDAIQAFENLAPEATPPNTGEAASAADASAADASAADEPPKKPKSDLEKAQKKLETALRKAQARLATLPKGDAKQRGYQQLQQLATAISGLNMILQGLQQQLTKNAKENTKENPAARADFERLRGMVIAHSETRLRLEQMAPDIHRDVLLLVALERAGGLIASVKWLDKQLKMVKKKETSASFDSELSLVMWPDDYQLLRWQPNYLRSSYSNSQLPKTFRTLMVARLDGPTLELAKALIDTAIEVEAKGLQGKVYIDNRGIGKLDQKRASLGSYADYDQSLLITAKGIEEQTDLEVILDTSPNLFQPGDCPDAALYCGWYSLAKYVDAFDWVPGAVAYHMASSEATTLRKPESQVWCKRMLEEGVCATIGPVYEPYLMAFPRPNDFFALLLQGDLTLVECYYRSKPYNSWMMTLIGDPLYRPFAVK